MELYQPNTNIADKIYEIIEKVTNAHYTSDFTLTIDDDEWAFSLSLNQPDAPLNLMYQGDEYGFLKFLERELRSRQLDRTRYYTGEQTTPGNGNEYIIFDYVIRKGNRKN